MAKQGSVPVPHSWSINRWPETVYPHGASKARWLVRSHRDELIQAGVLSRVGRELVVLGSRYSRWLESRTTEVPGYECSANRSAAAAA